MVFDPVLLMYLLTFVGVFAIDFGLFDFLSDDEEDEAEEIAAPVMIGIPGYDDAPEEGPVVDASAYSAQVSGSDGADTIIADGTESGVAYLLGAGDDMLIATGGADYADGGAGNDILTLTDGDDIAAGGTGDDSIRGGEGDDELWGQEGNDLILGHGGDDVIYGGSGADTIEGGYGDDTIYGGDGDDIISTDTLTSPTQMGRGIDVVDGGAGDDTILLGDGDQATGGEGADTFAVYEVESPDAPAAHVTDFNAAEDSLEIHYYAQTDPDTGDPVDPGLSIAYDSDADVTSVSIYGEEIATLDGDAGIAEENVTLTEIT